MKRYLGPILAGAGAGILNGIFGAGGGMVLAPLLGAFTNLTDAQLFPNAVMILLPICVVSLLFAHGWELLTLAETIPYLLGSFLGGLGAGLWGKHIPTIWLHRGLGCLILWGGIRYLW